MWVCQSPWQTESWTLMFHDASVHGFGGQANGEIHLGYDTWASLVAQRVKNLPAMWETWVQSLGWEDSPGEGKGCPLQYSGLENMQPMGTLIFITACGIFS